MNTETQMTYCGRSSSQRWTHWNRLTRLLIAITFCYLLVPVLTCASTLKNIDYRAQGNNRVDINLLFDGPISRPESFSTDSPARISVDLPGVINELTPKKMSIGIGSVHSLIALQTSSLTRVVLNLTDPVNYELITSGNRLTIRIDQRRSAGVNASSRPVADTLSSVAPSSEPAWARANTRSARVRSGPAVRDIDFRRGSRGEGRVMVRLPNADTRVIVREEGRRVFLELQNASLPQRLFRRLEVTDFGTPVTAIEARPSGRNVEITVMAEGDFDQMAYQTDELFTLDFRPLTPAEKEQLAREKVVYDGDRLSLNFQDIEVRAVLQVLADFTDLNLVASDSVSGNITLRLKNVPWDQALDIILKTKGLAMRQTGNVIMVAPAEEMAAQEQVQMESLKKIEELAPLRTEFIQVNYAKASELADFIRGTAVSVNPVTGQNSMTKDSVLSERGNVTVDPRTNTLVVIDTVSKIEKIRDIVTRLDIPVRQVMIESRVVIANNDFARDLGVRFGVSGSVGSYGGHEVLIGGGQQGNVKVGDFYAGPFGLTVPDKDNPNGKFFNSVLQDDDGNANIITNLPVTDPAGAVNFLIGKVGSYLIQLELSAMQREGRGEIISSPRVITSDQTKAVMKVGSQIPYRKLKDGDINIEFKDAVLKLEVTPRITPDERIVMDLEVNKDNPDWTKNTESGPPIETRAVKTNVLVDNGETVVLGGVFEQQKTFNKEQVPWLGDVPLVGRLFKKEERKDENTELLIFVTPKILKSDIARN